MSIDADLKKQPRMKRFFLVRVTGSRRVNDDLELSSGTKYVMDWPYDNEPFNVKSNGSEMTRSMVNASLAGRWYFNRTTWQLEVNTATPPSDDLHIVAFYYLFYTKGAAQVTGFEPTDAIAANDNPPNPACTWEPKLKGDPTTGENVSEIFSGILELQSSGIEIMDPDDTLREQLGEENSFFQKAVTIWLCFETTANIHRVFDGYINGITPSHDSIKFTFYSVLGRLQQPAFMGSGVYSCFLFREADGYPDLDPNRHGVVLPMVLSEFSSYRVTSKVFGALAGAELDPDSLLQASCIDYVEGGGSGTDNRKWICARIPGSAIGAIDEGTISSFISAVGQFQIHYASEADKGNLRVGQTFKIDEAVIGTTYMRVVREDATVVYCTHGGGNPAYTVGGATFDGVNLSIVLRRKSDKQLYFPNQIDDYTVDPADFHPGAWASGEPQIYGIEFDASYNPGSTNISPENFEVFFRIGADPADITGAGVAEQILNSAGILVSSPFDVDALAFAQTTTAFQIPYKGETSYQPYQTYLQALLQSMLAFIRQNSEGEIEFYLWTAPAAGTAINKNLYFSGSVDVSVQYQDIYTEIVATNKHITHDESATAILQSSKAKYLHGIDRTLQMNHVLSSIADRIEAIGQILFNRRVIYSFGTFSENIETLIGDNSTITTTKVLGGAGSANLKVIGLQKSADDVGVSASPLGELS